MCSTKISLLCLLAYLFIITAAEKNNGTKSKQKDHKLLPYLRWIGKIGDMFKSLKHCFKPENEDSGLDSTSKAQNNHGNEGENLDNNEPVLVKTRRVIKGKRTPIAENKSESGNTHFQDNASESYSKNSGDILANKQDSKERSIAIEGSSETSETENLSAIQQKVKESCFCQEINNNKDDNSSQQNSDPTITGSYYRSDGSLNYDALYEDSADADLTSTNKCSVFKHLISKVKPGMDLMSIPLPLYLLEPRSILEMFSDHFAYPDLFVKIADQETEKDRIVQVVKMYLSSFHVVRKNDVAKKPYNSVLGEVFRCHWDVPGIESNTASQQKNKEGPVPWAKRNQLVFIGEQVSHHPPISAFYVEHYDKKISMGVHILTKSEYLISVSVAVRNIGTGIIDVLNHRERYYLTFPDAYGRALLKVPWVELVGTTTIICEQTKYRAEVTFHPQGMFWGSERHQVTAYVYGPDDEKPFLTINGKWNGVMNAVWSNGKKETFLDLQNLSRPKKIVRPIARQEDNESRKIWKEVTAGIRLDDEGRASKAKNEVEEKQRNDVKQRKRDGIVWKTKEFESDGDAWKYKYTLAKRLNTEL